MDPRVVAAEWSLVLPLAAACLAPGAALALSASGRLRLNAAEVAGLAFALTVALFSAAATLVWLLHGSLAAAGALFLVLAAASWALAVRGGRLRAGLRALREGWSGLAIAGACAVVAAVQRPWFFTSSDIFYHVAAVRSLVRSGAVFPTDPIYGTATLTLDPTSGVWHSMLAGFARATGADPATLWLAAIAVGAFVLSVCVWALLRRVSRHDRVADGMTLLLLAGVYLFELRASGYPNQVSFALALLFCALLARAVEEADLRYAWLAGVAGFATATMHLGSAELVALLGVAFAAWTLVLARVSRAGDDAVQARAAGYPLLALAVAFLPALPVVLPRFAALEGSSVIGESTMAAISGEVLDLPLGLRMMVPGHYLGPAWLFLLGLAACAWALVRSRGRGGRTAVAAVAVASLAAVLLVNPIAGTLVLGYSAHMARRLAKLLPFAPYVGVAWACGVALAGSPRGRRAFLALTALAAAFALACLMLFGTVPARWPQRWPGERGVVAAWPKDRRWYWGVDTLATLRAEFAAHGRTPVLAGSPAACYQLTGLLDAYALSVVEAHSPYHVEVESGRARREDDAAIADAATPDDQRHALAVKWGAAYLAFDDDPRYDAVRRRVLADTAHFAAVTDGRLLVVRVLP